jgi:hypothetical protein
MSTINDLIQSAVAGTPAVTADHFNALMGERIAAKIDALIPVEAAAMFTPAASEE